MQMGPYHRLRPRLRMVSRIPAISAGLPADCRTDALSLPQKPATSSSRDTRSFQHMADAHRAVTDLGDFYLGPF